MASANVNDRASIERLYPRDAFDADAAQNARDKASVLHGVLIVSEPSESGDFGLQRVSRHAGEKDPLGDTVFLAPFPDHAYGALTQTSAYGAQEESGKASESRQKEGGYDGFIDRILAAASNAAFKKPIGRHEPRLRGFHGG